MTVSDPRIEGFMRAISAYFNVEYSELESCLRGGRGGDGMADSTQSPAVPGSAADGGTAAELVNDFLGGNAERCERGNVLRLWMNRSGTWGSAFHGREVRRR